MTILIPMAAGLAAGAHASIWGMYKDSPYEGFTWGKFRRSMTIGAVVAPVVAFVLSLSSTRAGDLILLFGAVYATERGLAELYKTFFRSESQLKYSIPMQFAVLGRPVASRAARAAAGLGYALAIGLTFGSVRGVEAIAPTPALLLLAGGAGGWLSALGGAWKDAPVEGFEILKFVRSPLLATGFGSGLSYLTTDLVTIAIGALGFTVASIETYKTFLRPSGPAGKFAGKPIRFPGLLAWRRRFVPAFVLIWLGVGAALAAAAAERAVSEQISE
jgi:hypothetical protein